MDEKLRKIWWLASFPKSGNTLVRMFLNTYVTHFPLDLNSAHQLITMDQQVNLYQSVAAKPISDCDPAEIIYLRSAMLMHQIQLVAPRDVWFKSHMANLEIDGIPLIPQRLTKEAVYIVRDPRDLVISYARHSAMSIDEVISIMASNNHVGERGGPIQDIIASWR